MHKFTKKRIAIGALGLLAVAGVAVAYFTTTGSGTGEAKVGTSSTLTIKAAVPTTLYPGTTSSVTFTVNNTSAQSQHVRTVELTEVKAYPTEEKAEKEEGAIAGCLSSWFKLTPNEPVAENQDVPASAETPLGTPGTLKFLNENVNQDECKNKFLVAHFTSN